MAEKIRVEATRAARDGSDNTETTLQNYKTAIVWRNGLLYAPQSSALFGYTTKPSTDQIKLDSATDEGGAVVAMTTYEDGQGKGTASNEGGGK